MAKVLNKLTPLTLKSIIKNAKEVGKANKEADGGGLYFIAEPNRSSWWRFDYRFKEKQKTLSVGTFPDISLAEAREIRSTLRNQVANGIDPSQQRKIEKMRPLIDQVISVIQWPKTDFLTYFDEKQTK